MSIPERTKWAIPLGLGILANALWDGIKGSWWPLFRLTFHAVSQLTFFVAYAVIAVYLGTKISKKNQPWTAMTADDAKHMRERVFAIWDQPEPHYGEIEPFICFRVMLVNATVFTLISERGPEGEPAYSGKAVRGTPTILNAASILPLALKHGARLPVIIRQPLSREVASQLNEQRGHVALDFSQVWINFKVEGDGAPDAFRLYGDADVTVTNRD